MTGWAEVAAAFAVFLISHALPARPAVRAPLVRALGQGAHSEASGRVFRRHPVSHSGVSGHPEMTPSGVVS